MGRGQAGRRRGVAQAAFRADSARLCSSRLVANRIPSSLYPCMRAGLQRLSLIQKERLEITKGAKSFSLMSEKLGKFLTMYRLPPAPRGNDFVEGR